LVLFFRIIPVWPPKDGTLAVLGGRSEDVVENAATCRAGDKNILA
jgi:hypothetical protein